MASHDHVREDERLLLAFFTSERSGPARRMESQLAQLAHKQRGRLDVTRVDVESQPAVAERFGVATVPTLVLVRGKRVVARLEGRASAPAVGRMLEPHLPRPVEAPPLAAPAPAPA